MGSNKDNHECFVLAHNLEEMSKFLCKRLIIIENECNNKLGTMKRKRRRIEYNLGAHVKFHLHDI